jgi:hypothetical protein
MEGLGEEATVIEGLDVSRPPDDLSAAAAALSTPFDVLDSSEKDKRAGGDN